MKHGAMPAVLLLAACSGAENRAGAPAEAETAPPAAPRVTAEPWAPATASGAAAAQLRAVKDETALYDFEYSYPAAAGAIPGLKASLDADLNEKLGKLSRDARAARDEAERGGFPYRKYSYAQTWQVVTDLPAWLSLSAAFSNYTGGAHGMYWSGAMLWDRKADRARDPLALFTSRQAFVQAIRAPFCDELDRQRASKRGEPVRRGSGDAFDECIDPAGQTVILGSRSGRAFDRIGILVAPYEAGPYAEGEYEVTVPVTPAVVAAVRPQFRGSFAAAR